MCYATIQAVTRSLVAACMALALLFGGAVSTGRAAEAWKDSPQVQALYEKAKEEGKVVIWGPQSRELRWIPEPFNERFPGIEVDWTPDLSAPAKVVAEYRAGRHTVDVFHFSLGGTIPLARRDILGENDYRLWGSDPNSIFFDGKAAATHNLLYSLVYHTELVDESKLPQTWEDLFDPYWQGKIAGSGFLVPNMLGYLALEWGEERTAKFARRLRDEARIQLTRAPRETILAAKERSAALADFMSAARDWQDQGIPVDWLTLDPTPVAQFVVASLREAPHPNAARLLAGWMTSPEAKRIREKRAYEVDVRPETQSEWGKQLRQQMGTLIIEDPSTMEARTGFNKTIGPIVTGQKQ